MTTDAPLPIDAPPPAAAALDRVIGIFTSPRETMRAIAAAPDWLIPLIIMLVLSAAGAFAAASQIDMATEMRTTMEKRMAGQQMSEEQKAKIDEQVEKMSHFSTIMFQWGWLTLPIWLVAISGALLAAFSIFGGSPTFKQAFAVTTYAWLPLTLRSLIASAVIAMREDPTTPTGMAAASYTNPAFLVDVEHSRALFMLLSAIDICTIFSLFLLTLGFSFASGLSRRTSAIIIVALWLVTVLLRVVPALFA